jgi:hypothetical protein
MTQFRFVADIKAGAGISYGKSHKLFSAEILISPGEATPITKLSRRFFVGILLNDNDERIPVMYHRSLREKRRRRATGAIF